jgi:phosphoketolase
MQTRTNPDHRQILQEWMRSYRPEGLFDRIAALAPVRTGG